MRARTSHARRAARDFLTGPRWPETWFQVLIPRSFGEKIMRRLAVPGADDGAVNPPAENFTFDGVACTTGAIVM